MSAATQNRNAGDTPAATAKSAGDVLHPDEGRGPKSELRLNEPWQQHAPASNDATSKHSPRSPQNKSAPPDLAGRFELIKLNEPASLLS